jgi:hypothetical protein
MPPTDPRYEALRERFSDILPETDDDPALTRLVRDLDTLMQAPVPAQLREMASQASIATTQALSDDSPIPYPTDLPARIQRRHRFGALIAPVAAALIVALLAGALLTRMAATPGQTGVAQVHYASAKGACAPGDITAHLPAYAEFGALDMVSPDEGWAVGAIVGDPKTPQYGSEYSLILHYTHCAWTPLGAIFPGVGLSSVSMGSAHDGWALGSTALGEPFALRYTNGSWLPVSPLPGADALHGGAYSYSSVRMLSANEGWISFNRVKDGSGNLIQGLLHLVNRQWSVVDTPFQAMETVLPVAPNDAWVVGYASLTRQTPAIYHYQAGTWTKMALPKGVSIYTLRMVSPNDIWASGQVGRGSSEAPGAILHYDGSQWRQVAVGANGSPQDVEAFDQGTAWAFTRYEPSVTTGYTPPPIIFDSPNISSAQYQRDGSWSPLAWPFKNLTRVGPIIRVSSDEYWAIGYHMVTSMTPTGDGSYSGGGREVGVLLYFANGVWHEYGR